MSAPSRPAAPLRLCIVDMNNGVENQAIRCFHVIVDHFLARVRAKNPGIDASLAHAQPRNLGEAPPEACDIYLSTGGPGSPFDGYDQPWCTAYRRFLDGLAQEYARRGDDARAAFLVCHSFEIAVEHFGFARMVARPQRKFGIQPVYMTDPGERSPLLRTFGDRLFAWEHRAWQAVGLDERKLAALGGELWARESRNGKSDKGEALLALLFAPGLEGVQFHPEADHAGAMAWLNRPEQARATIEAFGLLTYERMLRTLDNPDRLARTFALLIPSWLVRRFNAMAPGRGWQPVPMPVYDVKAALAEFGAGNDPPPGAAPIDPE